MLQRRKSTGKLNFGRVIRFKVNALRIIAKNKQKKTPGFKNQRALPTKKEAIIQQV